MSYTVNTYVPIGSNSFNRFYVMDFDNVKKLSQIMSGQDFISKIAGLFTKPSDYVTSIRKYPFTLSKVLATRENDYLVLGGYKWDSSKSPVGKVNTFSFSSTYLIAYFSIPKATNFYELAPYTSMQLFIPYFDFITLDVNEINGKFLQVSIGIDFSTGYGTVYLETKDDNGVTHLIASKSAKVGADVSWGATNNAERLRDIATTIASTAISIYSLGAGASVSGKESAKALAKVGSAVALGKGATSIVNQMQLRYERGGVADGFGKGCSPNTPYVIIKKPKMVEVDETEFAHAYGIPLYESRTLSTVHGFTVVDEIHLENFGTATSEEITEIEQLLKTGVHL